MPAEDPGEDFRVQRFDSSVHHFRKPGVVGHVLYGNSRFGQVAAGAASGINFNTSFGKTFGELDDARFVANTNKSAFDFGGCHEVQAGFGVR